MARSLPQDANGSDSRRVRWQFSLRSLMIGVTIFCTVLGLGAWMGVGRTAVLLLVANLSLVGFAVYTRRKRLAICASVCVPIVAAGPALCFFAPYRGEVLLCRICGKVKGERTVLGLAWSEKELDTDRSRWYRHAGLRAHAHEWVFLCVTERHWGGSTECYDWFGFEIAALDRLREVSEIIDPATFQELAEEYHESRQDRGKLRHFYERCDAISPPEGSENNGR